MFVFTLQISPSHPTHATPPVFHMIPRFLQPLCRPSSEKVSYKRYNKKIMMKIVVVTMIIDRLNNYNTYASKIVYIYPQLSHHTNEKKKWKKK